MLLLWHLSECRCSSVPSLFCQQHLRLKKGKCTTRSKRDRARKFADSVSISPTAQEICRFYPATRFVGDATALFVLIVVRKQISVVFPLPKAIIKVYTSQSAIRAAHPVASLEIQLRYQGSNRAASSCRTERLLLSESLREPCSGEP